MENIVITGSSRGIGFGLASAVLARGRRVLISSRSTENLELALEELKTNHPGAPVFSLRCDVTVLSDLEARWKKAEK